MRPLFLLSHPPAGVQWRVAGAWRLDVACVLGLLPFDPLSFEGFDLLLSLLDKDSQLLQSLLLAVLLTCSLLAELLLRASPRVRGRQQHLDLVQLHLLYFLQQRSLYFLFLLILSLGLHTLSLQFHQQVFKLLALLVLLELELLLDAVHEGLELNHVVLVVWNVDQLPEVVGCLRLFKPTDEPQLLLV